MPSLTVLVKPASSSCNLNCKYCFYISIAESRKVKSYGIMTIEVLERLVQRALEYADNSCTFVFQGGEPTIAGLEFYYKFIEFTKIYNLKKLKLKFMLQTNGTLIDEKWANFLAVNDFLVGISLDGPKDIHNLNRVDVAKNGSFNKVMKAVKLLNKFKVEYNIVCVVTTESSKHVNKIYNFFKKNNFKYLQFIPCLDPINKENGIEKYSLKPDDFYRFLKQTFDLWYEDLIQGNFIYVRYFDNLVGMLQGYPPEACGIMGKCQCHCVMEADGGVYPCDFYALDVWHLGNIKEKNFMNILNSEVGSKFIEASSNISSECVKCKWYNLCGGGCRRNRENFLTGELVLNYYCSAYKEFFNYAYEKLKHAARIQNYI